MKPEIEVDIKDFLNKISGLKVDFRESIVVETMREVSKKVKEEAQMRCPIDEEHLVKDIKYRVRKDANKEGATGRAYIDPGGASRDYAMYIHEDDEYKLGEKSRAKQMSVSVRVGNKFLERAVTENQDELQKIVRDALERGFKKHGGV